MPDVEGRPKKSNSLIWPTLTPTRKPRIDGIIDVAESLSILQKDLNEVVSASLHSYMERKKGHSLSYL